MEILGYAAAVLIGVSLGLIGGGGSILTVPVLVYLFGIDAVQATSYSLFVVGVTSLVGAAKGYRAGLVNVQTALLFGISSIATVFLTRRFIVPAIPETIFTINGSPVGQGLATMVMFALLMLMASWSMLRPKRSFEESPAPRTSKTAVIPRLLLYGLGIGLVTGLLGAGGGFLLIPTLVVLLRMPMKVAVSTSLLIIALNSLIGFTGDLGQLEIDWSFLATITAIAIAGILIGGALSSRLPGARLKKGFGWFVLLMGVYILIKELIIR
jgi:uncharacterized membrane protein YfcA